MRYTYTVLLILSSILIGSCNKVTDLPKTDSTNKFPKMDKVKATAVRKWKHRIETSSFPGSPIDTVSFALSFANDSTILYEAEKILIPYSYSTDSTYCFNKYEGGSPGSYSFHTVTYFFKNGSMILSNNRGGGGGYTNNIFETID